MTAATCADTLAELSRLGSPTTKRTYERHGGDGVFGVSFAHLGKIAGRIKRNHPLALALWQSGQPEARILALMVADPALNLTGWLGALLLFGANVALALRKTG